MVPTVANGLVLAEPRVVVALATWNGARWLPEQLASIATQTVPVHVVAGDDSSDDGTPALLAAWANRLPGGLTLLPSAGRRLGARDNFARVLAACPGTHVACCDQDDVWDDHHVETLLQTLEGRDDTIPAVATADMRVVDGELSPIHSSFYGLQAFDPIRGAELRTLAVMNVFPGCSMLVNRALLRMALPIPPEAPMHDWWLALCAAACGHVVVNKQTIASYRIHGGNTMGAQKFSLYARLRAGLDGNRVRAGIIAAARQCDVLLKRHRDTLPSSSMQILADAAELANANWLRRRCLLAGGTLRRHPISRQVRMALWG
jgi:glycosyltransferase involved in cell wall biosynthesis